MQAPSCTDGALASAACVLAVTAALAAVHRAFTYHWMGTKMPQVVIASVLAFLAVAGAGAYGLTRPAGACSSAAAAANSVLAWVAAAYAAVLLAWLVLLLVLYTMTSSCLRRPPTPPASPAAADELQVDFIEHATLQQLLGDGCGRLGMHEAPGRHKGHLWRDLRRDVATLRNLLGAGGGVVTLCEARDLQLFDASTLPTDVHDVGLSRSVRFPIRDKWLPTEGIDSTFVDLIDSMLESLQEGAALSVHCNGGKGRTGTVVACCLLAASYRRTGRAWSLAKVIRVMRKARPGMLKNPLQQLFCRSFVAAYMRNNRRSPAAVV